MYVYAYCCMYYLYTFGDTFRLLQYRQLPLFSRKWHAFLCENQLKSQNLQINVKMHTYTNTYVRTRTKLVQKLRHLHKGSALIAEVLMHACICTRFYINCVYSCCMQHMHIFICVLVCNQLSFWLCPGERGWPQFPKFLTLLLLYLHGLSTVANFCCC